MSIKHLALMAMSLLAMASMTVYAADTGGQAAVSDDSVVIGFTAEPVSLDFTTHDGAAIPQVLLYNVYETLVKVGPDGGIVPSLATSWTVSDDGKTYVFDLVDDAYFTNGKKFTAKDAVFSINYVKDNWTISLKQAMDVVASAEAVSPTKLKVTLEHRDNSWLYKMTTRIGAMMTESAIDELATNPVGTGPYKLETWRRGDKIVLVRNDDYWGDKPYFKNVTFAYIESDSAMTNALLSGTIDVISRITPYSLRIFQDNPKFKIVEGTTTGEVLLSMNNNSKLLDDVRVRRAIRYGINNDLLRQACMDGYGTNIGSMVPPTVPWYEDLTGMYPYNPDKAKALLKEAGAANATLRLRLPGLNYAKSCGTVVASQLKQLGLNVQMDVLEFPAAWLTKVFHNSAYDLTIIQHVEPHDMIAVFGNPDYYIHYDNAEVQELFAKAKRGTRQEQIEYMKAAARIISEDAASGFLFLYPNLIVADKDITGLPKNDVSQSFEVYALGRK